MAGLGLLFLNFVYLVFFISYFIFSYGLHKNLVLPYFLLNTIILILEFFTLNGSHKTFIISIIFNVGYFISVRLSKESKENQKVLQTLPLFALVPYLFLYFVIYGSKLNIVLPYLTLNCSCFLFSLVAFIILIAIMFKKQLLSKYIVGVIFLVYFMVSFLIITHNIENKIKDVSIKRFGITPQCVDINFDITGEFKSPHALVKKGNKYYYWSFRENDFIENNRIQGC